ncbi:MAG: tetratricopeptide repeat protein [Acidobacteria bacterium]|nr:tetratricopeptide repeat protein [Acidobacteriota bacterium]
MNRRLAVLVILLGLVSAAGVWWAWRSGSRAEITAGFAGSGSCRECHERFYELWATSHHGTAMQPFSPSLGRILREAPPGEIEVGPFRYRPHISDSGASIVAHGPDGEREYPIAHALGGKNVYYLLTPLERGRLQVLPLAFDVRKKAWFDAAGSMIRHFTDIEDRPLDWKDPALTFNTSCQSCHVSQLSTNYDLASDTYRTTWAEPGINCETCHGPGGEHVRIFKAAPPGQKPRDLGLTSSKRMTVAQQNSTCAPCHAKMMVVTPTFSPGDRFFDHFDLAALENADFYPDGRDLGENYTYTTWLMSPCVQSGTLDCVHCHTSSGRFRWQESPNGACMQCHADKIRNLPEHTRHKPEGPGSLCISCHMPMTEFARMRRSDHSMLPPTPAATLAFKSPNACNLCHADRDAAWADRHVRKWRPRDYQKAVLHRAGLIAAARKSDWSRLPEMLEYVTSPARDEIFAASLIRLLELCPDERKWPVVADALKDTSPLVRAASAVHLGANLSAENVEALLRAVGDDYRLVRVRAARSLAIYPRESLSTADRDRLERASQELVASLQSRLDDWASHFNLGSYYLDRGEPQRAVASFEIASRLRPDVAMPYVNVSIAHARLGQNLQAEQALRKALEVEPQSTAANFNLGLLKAEQNDLRGAERHLRAALKTDPDMAEAAYNLAVIVANGRLDEAVALCRRAVTLRPNEQKYAYTLGFYLYQSGRADEARRVLQDLIARHPGNADAYALLGSILESRGQVREARTLYRQALADRFLSDRDKTTFEMKLTRQ